MTETEHYQFKNPGKLIDKDLELIVVEERPGIAAEGIVPEYKFEMRHRLNGEIVGNISLRTKLTPRLAEYGGHIGYEVETQHQGKGYAARSCKLILDLAKTHSINPVLITCGVDNIASRKTCENIGAKLIAIREAETKSGEQRQTCYYHVYL